MMDQQFTIFLARLTEDKKEKIDFTRDPSFLDVQGVDYSFEDPVKISGEAYLANDSFILLLNIVTKATLPCSICNTKVKVPIVIKDLYYSEEISQLKDPTYNFSDLVREEIILQTPFITECNEGDCPARADISSYLRKTDSNGSIPREQFPFSNLRKDD